MGSTKKKTSRYSYTVKKKNGAVTTILFCSRKHEADASDLPIFRIPYGLSRRDYVVAPCRLCSLRCRQGRHVDDIILKFRELSNKLRILGMKLGHLKLHPLDGNRDVSEVLDLAAYAENLLWAFLRQYRDDLPAVSWLAVIEHKVMRCEIDKLCHGEFLLYRTNAYNSIVYNSKTQLLHVHYKYPTKTS